MMPLYETSAKDDFRQDNVEAIFMTLAFKLKNSKPFYIPSQLNKANIQSVNSSQNNNADNNSCSC